MVLHAASHVMPNPNPNPNPYWLLHDTSHIMPLKVWSCSARCISHSCCQNGRHHGHGGGPDWRAKHVWVGMEWAFPTHFPVAGIDLHMFVNQASGGLGTGTGTRSKQDGSAPRQAHPDPDTGAMIAAPWVDLEPRVAGRPANRIPAAGSGCACTCGTRQEGVAQRTLSAVSTTPYPLIL